MRSFDVIVVGAGPAGAYTAHLLAEEGHHVALLDENERPRKRIVCTGIVSRDAYQQLQLPEEAIIDKIDSAFFVSPSGESVPYEPPQSLAYVVDRTSFDLALTERATRSGAILLRGHAARGVRKDRTKVTVSAEVSGHRDEIEGRSLVVATGHQRWLHEEADLGVPPGYVHGVHADLPFENLDATELYFGNDVAPGFFGWATPYGSRTARLGVLSEQGSKRYFRRLIRKEVLRSRLRISPSDDEAIKARLQSRAIVQGPVDPSYADRTLAVGEAAGQVKTTTAGGIYYGLIGGSIAAEVLDEALRNDCLSRSNLAKYQDVWWERLGSEISSGLELQTLAKKMEDDEIDRLFTTLNNGLGGVIRQVIRFDWHHPALKALFSRKQLWRDVMNGRLPLSMGK